MPETKNPIELTIITLQGVHNCLQECCKVLYLILEELKKKEKTQ